MSAARESNATHKSVDCQVASRDRVPAWKAIYNAPSAATCAPTAQARGLSQEAFADELGVHRTYMGGIERGERNLTLKSLERIASQIDLDPLALLQPPEAESAARSLSAATA